MTPTKKTPKRKAGVFVLFAVSPDENALFNAGCIYPPEEQRTRSACQESTFPIQVLHMMISYGKKKTWCTNVIKLNLKEIPLYLTTTGNHRLSAGQKNKILFYFNSRNHSVEILLLLIMNIQRLSFRTIIIISKRIKYYNAHIKFASSSHQNPQYLQT